MVRCSFFNTVRTKHPAKNFWARKKLSGAIESLTTRLDATMRIGEKLMDRPKLSIEQ